MRHVVTILAGTLLIIGPAAGARAAENAVWSASHAVRYFALRLRPGEDLLGGLRSFAKERKLAAAFVVSCAGSATHTSVRYANQPSAAVRDGHFEIVSLSGTLTADGAHIHAAFADSTGATFGGHLMEGTRIYTTAEIVIGEMDDVTFAREPDSTYGYRELVPRPRTSPRKPRVSR